MFVSQAMRGHDKMSAESSHHSTEVQPHQSTQVIEMQSRFRIHGRKYASVRVISPVHSASRLNVDIYTAFETDFPDLKRDSLLQLQSDKPFRGY